MGELCIFRKGDVNEKSTDHMENGFRRRQDGSAKTYVRGGAGNTLFMYGALSGQHNSGKSLR